MALDPDHVQWCRNMFALLRDGGVWGVPACGLMWMKRNDQLVLTARMPWMPEMEGVITREELKHQQDELYADTVLHFNAAGITVVDSTIEI
jgi:hypothetical protein